MYKNSAPPLGIIEGFFGRSWSWEVREEYAEFLAASGYNFYIYAPKSDAFLRKKWQHTWPKDDFAALSHLRRAYGERGIQFGIGLSPYEIYLDDSGNNRTQLLNKIDEINALRPDILCLLFDDMRGDVPELAGIQTELTHLAAARSNAQKIVFCPSYYSFDPVLEKVFGTRPHNYWQNLGKILDSSIDIFWTGPKVCSEEYPIDHVQQVTDLLQRKPFLWDNYPVNDGAVKSSLLQLRAFPANHGQLTQYIAGHAVNPMNQPWLSRVPLLTLPRAYHDAQSYDAERAFAESCIEQCGIKLGEQIVHDIASLQDQGLGQLNTAQRAELLARYSPYKQNPFAQEICSWLNNEYVFDPNCLTQ